MECHYVRESNCLCFCFHPQASTLFYLTNTKNRLRIIEENLYTGLVVNELNVPLKEQNLNVDNYILNYSHENKHIILTLSNHILIYSLELKSLIFITDVQHNKNPCFIEQAALYKNTLYFSATDHHQLFSININQTLRTATIPNFSKFKLPPEVFAVNIALGYNKLIAICSDNNLRVWDCDSGTALKGAVLQKIGQLTCLSFSKGGEYLLIGTSIGIIQVWDGATLGLNNTLVLNKNVCKERIQSLSWFNYSGQAQSRRFLMLTKDRNIKLFSFYFQRIKQGKQKWMGKANELSLLYINKCKIQPNFEIKAHEYANYIYFHPGVLFYMVDYYPRIYYPVIAQQYYHSFDSLVPNKGKEIYWQPNFFFVDGLYIKRLDKEIQTKVSLGSVLEYDGLKILKMDCRPKFCILDELPIKITKGVPSHKLRYKFLINYYLGNMVRSIVLSNIGLLTNNENIQNFKEYSGHIVIFIGPQRNIDPLILILQEDKQTITVLSESSVQDVQMYTEQEKVFLKQAGELYTKQLKIKVQKIFETPFRNSYVVLYLSDNLIRFSNNIHIQSSLIDYDVYLNLSLRLDYTDIIIDVLWTSQGQFGCVVCLTKIIFINDELKVIRSVNIQGYVIQGQFIGYTLILTTKVDVQYIDIYSKPLQLYCIENYESKYLILGILADRLIGIQKFKGAINCKIRYFNLMQPLISGYINFYSFKNTATNGQIMKSIIEGFSPYHVVSEEFLMLLNMNGWSHFSKYFIQSHVKLYSRTIRAITMNSEANIERFIEPKIWNQHKTKILDYFLYYEELKDSSDNYEIQKSRQFENKLIKIITAEGLHKIKESMNEQSNNQNQKLTILPNFGEQAIFQVYYIFSEKENIFVKMQLLPFKANDDIEWIGVNSLYLQSKIGNNDNDLDLNAVKEQKEELQNHNEKASDEQQGGQFKDLIVYYRFDDGKGDFIDDLADYHNEATLIAQDHAQVWKLLDNEPMELEDKWGKKCPPQYSVSGVVRRQKRLGGKTIKDITIQLWIKYESASFKIIKIGESFELGLQQNEFYLKVNNNITSLKPYSQQDQLNGTSWTNITFTYLKSTFQWIIYVNANLYAKGKADIKFDKSLLEIGSEEMNGEYTQFRLWRKMLSNENIKEYMRSPLEIVAEKRKKLKMRIKQKKKKKEQTESFPSFPF